MPLAISLWRSSGRASGLTVRLRAEDSDERRPDDRRNRDGRQHPPPRLVARDVAEIGEEKRRRITSSGQRRRRPSRPWRPRRRPRTSARRCSRGPTPCVSPASISACGASARSTRRFCEASSGRPGGSPPTRPGAARDCARSAGQLGKACHSEPPLAGAKNLAVGARLRPRHSEMLRFAQHDSPQQVCQEIPAQPGPKQEARE